MSETDPAAGLGGIADPYRQGAAMQVFRVVRWVGVVSLVLLVAAQPSPAGESLQPIRIRAAVLRHFPPQYSTAPDGTPQGFAVDVLKEVAELARVNIEYVVKESWQEVFEAVRTGEADLIPNQGITERREQWFAFTSPVETFPVSVFTRESRNDFSSESDLAGKTVAVVRLNIGEVLLAQMPSVRATPYNDVQAALFALLSGSVDALIFPDPVLWKLARDAGVDDHIKTVGRPLAEIRRAISVSRENRALRDRLDAAVDRFVGTQRYRDIYVKWYGRPAPFWTATRVAGAMAALLAGMLLVMGLWRYVSVMRLNRRLTESIERRDLAERRLQEAYDTLEQKVKERTLNLEKALSEVRTLTGLLPICSHCKRIRDDQGYWNQIEAYIQAHSDAEFTHGICRECAEKLYPDLKIKDPD